MGRAHVLAIPYPALGHVIPLMELAQRLSENGIKVTFVNTEFIHQKMMKVQSPEPADEINRLLSFASIPDGLEAWEDRTVEKLEVAIRTTLPQKIEALIEEINRTNGGEDKVTGVIVDHNLTLATDFAAKMGIKRTGFVTSSAAMLAYSYYDQKLMDEGLIDADGIPLKQEVIKLSQEMPAISTLDLPWTRMGDLTTQKHMFNSFSGLSKRLKVMDRYVCNSSYVLEPGALGLVPECAPVGPLLSRCHGQAKGHFWAEDAACISWLDQQPPNSTIFVSFGSSTILDEIQFRELALGLQLTNRRFLWVVRPGLTQDNIYPEGIKDGINYKIIHWAPQQKVLAHPSVSCFVSHCGWNSTIEGISYGVPFLCWPYYADQMLNQAYISDYWKVGLKLMKDECSGIITKEEIKNKVELLLSDNTYKARASNLQAKVISSTANDGGGTSQNKFWDFVDWIKEN